MADIASLGLTAQVVADLGGREVAHLVLVQPTPHDFDGFVCWCQPRFIGVCDDCDTGCWKCDNGTMPLTADEASRHGEVVLALHR